MSILLFFVLGSFLAPQGEEKENYYQKWLEEDVIYIITEEEKSVFLKLTTAEERDRFIEQFWRRRDPDPKTIANEFKEEHYRRVAYANDHFGAGLPGWQTDRGRYYIKYGPPDDIESRAGGSTYQRPNSEGGGLTTVYPFEVWYYRHLEGIGQNIEIEFVDRHGGGLYTVARDEMEKDALLYVPGLGLTQAESLGLTSKAKRLQQRYYGDLEQKYRGQFYVPEYDNQPFEKLLQKSLLQKPPQIRYKDLQALVSTRIHYNQVPLEVAVHLLRVAGDLSLIPVTLQLPPADLRIYGRVENLTHRIIYEFEDQVEVDPQAEQEIVYQKSIPIQGPGRFKLTMVAEDTQNKRVGMVEKAFLVPEFSSEELSLSSLILADKIRLADAERRYTLSGYEIYPNVDGEFPHKGYFGIYLEAYNAALDSQRNEPVIEVDFVIRSDGRVIDSSPQALPQSETTIRNLGNRIVITKLFSLRHLAPGHYQFIARVQDKVSGERKERRTEFKVGGPLMQQLQQARQYHEQGEYGLAAEAYRKAIKLDPHKGEAYNNLGSVLTKLARHSEAVEAFREAARLLPEVIDIEKNLANAYFQWERYPDAIKHLEKYLGSRPNDFSARHLLGLSLFLHGEVGRAIQTLEDLRSLGRKDMGVLYTLSVAYIRAGRFSEAQDVLASLFKAHSGSAESHLLLAQALEGQHKYREALDEVNRALELNPELALAHFYKGRIYWRQAKAEQAEAEFSRELQINPKHTDSFYFRGTVRFFEQRFDDAEADFRRALELDPQHFPARFHLARSLLKMNEYQAAAAHLKKTVQMDPTHSETYYLLGRALQKMGQAEEARKYLERARQLGDQKSRNLREEFSQAAKPH